MQIQIHAPGGLYSGRVKSRVNNGTTQAPNWYVEFTHDEASMGKTGAPGYWKQQLDGGRGFFLTDEDDAPIDLTNDMLRAAVLATVERLGLGPTSFAMDVVRRDPDEKRKQNLEALAAVLEDVGLSAWHPQFILNQYGQFKLVAAMDNSTDSTKSQQDVVQVELPNIFGLYGKGADQVADDYAHGSSKNRLDKFVEAVFLVAAIGYERLRVPIPAEACPE